jgi:hypothetical protein
MVSAFLETTVLTDYLLKKDGSERAAANVLSDFNNTIVPQFAWKEFKRGPLSNFKWAHNKLAETGSFAQTLSALQRLSRTPQRYLTSTAIQALHSAFVSSFDGVSLQDLQDRYGSKATMDNLLADALRLEIKRAIFASWRKRKTLFGGPHHRLKCYPDADLHEVKLRVEINPRDCPADTECCLKEELSTKKKELSHARAALRGSASRPEITNRLRVLRQIEKHPQSKMGPLECRRFGDAYFVIFCPADAVIITTNVRDIEPMATRLGINVKTP